MKSKLLLFIVISAALGSLIFSWTKKGELPDLLLTGYYSEIPGYPKPILMIIDPNNSDVEMINLKKIGDTDFLGIHEARSFKFDGKYRLAFSTYHKGNIYILASDSPRFSNFTLEFVDKFENEERGRPLINTDIDGDGKDEVIVGTRPSGILKYYKYVDGKWNSNVIDEVGTLTAIHDLIASDMNGDGIKEIFATISSVNEPQLPKLKHELPKIIRYQFADGKWSKDTVWTSDINTKIVSEVYPHPRYILSGDFEGNGQKQLVSGIKAADSELMGFLTWKWDGRGYEFHKEDLPNDVKTDTEVITSGDLDKNGKDEIIVPSFKSDSILSFEFHNGKWERSLLISDVMDGESDKIISGISVLDSEKDGHKKLLYVVAEHPESEKKDVSGAGSIYILEYDSKNQRWNKKRTNIISLPNLRSWGIFPMQP